MSVPTEGWVHKHVCFVTDALIKDPRVLLIRPTHKPYENNLHQIRNQMLADGFDWWLNIDADNPPTRNPLELIDLDKDIIGLPTPVWHYTEKSGERPVYWNAYKKVEGGFTEWGVKEGLQRVDAIGTGCFLVKRKVMEDLRAPFQRIYNEDGTVNLGNDLAFCTRASLAGFGIYAHFDYPCLHFKELELTEIIRAFNGLVRT